MNNNFPNPIACSPQEVSGLILGEINSLESDLIAMLGQEHSVYAFANQSDPEKLVRAIGRLFELQEILNKKNVLVSWIRYEESYT
jgi:hypothetical protein